LTRPCSAASSPARSEPTWWTAIREAHSIRHVRTAAFLDGTRFGLLLQLAVGPVCLFVLHTGSDRGAWQAMVAVAGVALVDLVYVALAILGVARWAESDRMRRALLHVGAAIVALFGLDVIASALGVPLLPSLARGGHLESHSSTLLGAILLTGSNPLTIVFWAGVFSAKVAAERYGRGALWLFSLGCVFATVAFLTVIALGGALVGRSAPGHLLQWLNVAVGCVLLYLAARLTLRGTRRE
jgi:threonine/homoserine/homoserine lactone efflux protein